MSKVLSNMDSSMIVPQGNSLPATGFCLPAAHWHTPITLVPFQDSTNNLCRRCLAWSQAVQDLLG